MASKISLIMTVYNRERFLAAAIESVLAQTYKDFELLVWDDGSSDRSLAIAQAYSREDPRIKVFAGSHQGRTRSLQAAHAAAQGTYLGWVDSDDLNRQVTDTNELGDTRSYAYDAVDSQIGMTDRNGRQMEYTYDELDRQTQETWLDAAGNPIRTFDYNYDTADQMTAVSDPDSAYSYTYDLAGRLTSADNAGTPGVPNVLLTYTYDAVNNMLTATDTIDGQASGLEEYTYDELDRVTRLTQSGNGVAEKRVDMAYDAASQMTGSTRYADLAGTQLVAQSDYSFDIAGRLTDLTHSRGTTVFADYGWDYDAANRITRFTSPDGTSDYNYDDRDQIVGSDHSYQEDEAYSYDNNGNRTNSGYETGDNNRLLNDGTYTYAYDAEGNRTTRTEIATGEVTEYTWDYRNRLTGVVTKDSAGNSINEVEYGYDIYNRRIEKTVDPDGDGSELEETERFVYDGDHIALVFDENGEQTHRYLHGPQIDQVLAEEIANGEVRWALADNQGTVRDVVDSDGTVLNHIIYDSFGQITGETNPEIDFRFSYTGREFDEETGQYYYRARYYDANVGRFISEDPIGFSAGDTNLSRYIFNSSTNFTDPSGEVLLFLAPGIPFAVKATLSIGAIVLAGSIGGSTHQEVESPELESPQPQTAPTPPPVAGRPQRGNTTDPNEDRNLRRKPDRRFGDDLGPNTDTQTDTQNINGTKTDECQGEKRKKCKVTPIPRKGGDPIHNKFATQISNSATDFLVETPEGQSISFDGLTPGTKHLWEAKTGHESVFFGGEQPFDSERSRDIFSTMTYQALTQNKISKRCNFDLTWAFNEPDVANRVQDLWSGDPNFPQDVRYIYQPGYTKAPRSR